MTESISLSLSVAACISLAEASPWLPASVWGESIAAAACLVPGHWPDCMLTQPKMSAVFNLEVACCITRCVTC